MSSEDELEQVGLRHFSNAKVHLVNALKNNALQTPQKQNDPCRCTVCGVRSRDMDCAISKKEGGEGRQFAPKQFLWGSLG